MLSYRLLQRSFGTVAHQKLFPSSAQFSRVRALSTSMASELRNVAIVAHVDHGKTTLVDRILAETASDFKGERVMDSMALEQERGITIMSKVTSVNWKGVKFNIVDTPGHADFGGEVERVLGMVDGVVLVVDGTEGPMAQTKFVVSKALERGLKPLVVVNKVDRSTVDITKCEDAVFDLLVSLDASDEQLDLKFIYASAKDGWAVTDLDAEKRQNMVPLLDSILNDMPPPSVRKEDPFSMVCTMMEHDRFTGRLVTGRIASGCVRVGDMLQALLPPSEEEEGGEGGGVVCKGRVTKLYNRQGMTRVEVDSADAGDIVTMAGLSDARVTHTVCDPSVCQPLAAIRIDPPTIKMTFSANDSPLAGKDGKKLTAQVIGDRLLHETQNNVSITVEPADSKEAFTVMGRGELQLGILIENMRREGFELSVSPPAVVYKLENGKRLEPVEEVTIDVDDTHAGVVVSRLTSRRATLMEMGPSTPGRTVIRLHVPSRALIGYRSVFTTDTHGSGILNRAFLEYQPYQGSVESLRKGAMVSMARDFTTSYALNLLEPRGVLFVGIKTEVYPGMVVGECAKETDLDVNPAKKKALNNIRTHSHDEQVRLTPPREVNLELAIGYVAEDELIEVTPNHIRLRKAELDPSKRKSAARKIKKTG